MNNSERLELAKERIIVAMLSLQKDFGMDAFVSMLVAESALYEFRKSIDLQLAKNEAQKKEADSK